MVGSITGVAFVSPSFIIEMMVKNQRAAFFESQGASIPGVGEKCNPVTLYRVKIQDSAALHQRAFRRNVCASMADITLNTKQYLTLMRAMAAAMTLDDHVAEMRDDKPDRETSELWESLIAKADDFGMSFPEDKEVGEHWGDIAFNEADEDLHALIDDEFWHLLAERLAEAAHAKSCSKKEGEHDEDCFKDVLSRVDAIEEHLDEGIFKKFI